MRLGSVLLVIWLVIGLIACVQRNYFNDKASCATAGTVVVTALASGYVTPMASLIRMTLAAPVMPGTLLFT